MLGSHISPDTQGMYDIKSTSPIMYSWLYVHTYAEGHSVTKFVETFLPVDLYSFPEMIFPIYEFVIH